MLRSFYNEEKERVGLILKDNSIVEAENTCTSPADGFETTGLEFLTHEGNIAATWHTHPNENSNLSHGDKLAFLNWPDLDHYIVGRDGISRYYIENGKVFRCDVESTFMVH